MSEEKKHAVLSASGSNKWLVCPSSARLEEQFEEKTSDYMEEGTLAHEIAEFKVRNYFFEHMAKRSYNSQLKKFEKRKYYNSEMLTYTDTYLEYIKELALQKQVVPFVTVEHTLDYSEYVPEGFGTADCLMISKDTLNIIDFKYGKGVAVSAENNSQMMLYALGAFEQFKYIFDIRKIKMSIVQPRLDNISESKITVEELTKWGIEVVKPKAEQAWRGGDGEFAQGEHCRFCRAKGRCEFRTTENIKKYEQAKSVALLSNEALGKVLLEVEGIPEWVKDLKEEALKQILQGNIVEGWKAVEGKSNRKIEDVDNAFEILEANGIEEAILYEKKPLSLSELEKVVGKKKLTELIGDHIKKPKGAPTLAKLNDKRKDYKESSAIEDFRKRGKLMDFTKMNELEKIGLAFVAGMITGNCIEIEEPKHAEKEESKIEIRKVTPKEMKQILDYLENKVIGGKSHGVR